MNDFYILNNEMQFETSLMIRWEYLEKLENLTKKFNGLNEFLTHLIQNYKTILNIEPKNKSRILTQYQDRNLKLKKVNFKPKSRDWLMLKNIAFHHGISISLLFAILFKKFLENRNLVQKKKTIVPLFKLKIFKELIFVNKSTKKYLQLSTLSL